MNVVILTGTVENIYPIQRTRRGTPAVTGELQIEDNTDRAATNIQIAAYGSMANFIARLTVGSKVLVEGTLHAYSFTRDGEGKKQKVEVRPFRITRVVDAAEVVDGPVHTEPR
jgi:single-stranded DNA-binding protein